MSLATPPVSDALGNSKGVMSQYLDVSLHCHCNLRTVSGGDIFLRRGNSQRIELRFRIEPQGCFTISIQSDYSQKADLFKPGESRAIFIRPDYPQKVNLFQTGGASPRGRFGFSLSEKSQ
jgi:hypothetical protein